MRGSLRNFPLQIEDTVVSDNRYFNDIIPNASYMLKKAFKDKSKIFDAKSTDELLSEYGFNNLNEAMAVLGEHSLTSDTINSIRQVLFAKAPDTLSTRQPNIVILMCESWSNYLLHLAAGNHALVYGLERHMKKDLLFEHYQSVSNATIGSIENLTVASPFARLFASKYRYTQLPTSITIPFTNSGYDCYFMTGMDIAWENVNEALTHQGFNEVIGKYELQKKHPEYKANTIGVYDHHLLNSLQEQLYKRHSKPQMVLVMTTTNHPPFDLPDDAKLSELPETFYNNKCFENVGKDVLKKYINAYRYFNKSLSDFLDRFKQSEAAKNTILIVTGDHNVRSILNYNTIGSQWQNSVPLYIYLPPYLRSKDYPNNTNKYGCHYDILPTIAPFAFKNVEYVKIGENLLTPNITLHNSYSYNECQILAEEEYKNKAELMARARNLLLRLYIQLVLGMNA